MERRFRLSLVGPVTRDGFGTGLTSMLDYQNGNGSFFILVGLGWSSQTLSFLMMV